MASAYYNRATAYYQNEDPDRALEDLDRAIELARSQNNERISSLSAKLRAVINDSNRDRQPEVNPEVNQNTSDN